MQSKAARHSQRFIVFSVVVVIMFFSAENVKRHFTLRFLTISLDKAAKGGVILCGRTLIFTVELAKLDEVAKKPADEIGNAVTPRLRHSCAYSVVPPCARRSIAIPVFFAFGVT